MNGDERPTRVINGQLVGKIARELEQSGLNLFAVLDRRDADDGTFNDIALTDGTLTDSTLTDSCLSAGVRSVALIGNSGRRLWNCLPAITGQEHPVDDYSRREVTRVLGNNLGESGWAILYPDRTRNTVPSLQHLGSRAGWHHPSPLGSGIHPQHGLWFAYRAVVVFNFELPESQWSVPNRTDAKNRQATGASPCLSCADQPCISACPASALKVGRVPNLDACSSFRYADQSPCAERCLARESCPLGLQSRYADAQINYHYRQSLESLRRWVAETASED